MASAGFPFLYGRSMAAKLLTKFGLGEFQVSAQFQDLFWRPVVVF